MVNKANLQEEFIHTLTEDSGSSDADENQDIDWKNSGLWLVSISISNNERVYLVEKGTSRHSNRDSGTKYPQEKNFE